MILPNSASVIMISFSVVLQADCVLQNQQIQLMSTVENVKTDGKI